MTDAQINDFRMKMTRLYQRADALIKKFQDADRHVLIQSWLMQEKTALEKLGFALLRGQALPKKQNANG